MLILNLIKKDFIIIKKQLGLLLLVALIIPLFVNFQLKSTGIRGIGFFIMVSFSEYLIYNAISDQENKYKASLYLSCTPYARKNLIIEKYLLVALMFIFCFISYTVLSFIPFTGLDLLSLQCIVIPLILISVVFGIFIPLQFCLGIDKAKLILIILLIICPTWGSVAIVKLLDYFNIEFYTVLQISNSINILLLFLSLLITFVSFQISLKIYSKRDL